MSLALIFPGQGSQFVGMAKSLAASEATAADTLALADEVLGFSLSGLMAEGPEAELTATKNAQPAILAHSVAVLRVAQEHLGPVSYAAGHSLGELSAHVAAGTIGFEDALAAVRVRGELMFEVGQQRPGGMAALIGLSEEEAEDVCGAVDAGTCVTANFNCRGQVVISGDVAGVAQGMELAQKAGAKRVVELSVSGAFHSPLMAPAAEGFRENLETIEFKDPRYPVISNVTAGPIVRGEEARELLVRQLTSPVRWSASIAAMLDKGVKRFVEVGPNRVLCGLNRRNAKGFECVSIGEPEDLAGLIARAAD